VISVIAEIVTVVLVVATAAHGRTGSAARQRVSAAT
jgi:hypothetical protein